LGKKTADLKKQGLKILALRGVKNLDQKSDIKSGAHWDDIQMTEELYQDIKNSFDEEQKLLETIVDDAERTTAPDFTLIPFAKWPMPIPFTTNQIKSASLKTKVRKAVDEIATKTGCITFEEVSGSPSKPYIQYREVQSLGEGTCANSPLGRQQTVNVINVATTCQNYGSIIHESLHSLGFAHTQQRPDVDQFITIHWENIIPSADVQVNFKPWKYALKNQGPFDYGSIMMYPSTAFTTNGDETLVPKRDPSKNRQLMGQRDHLSTEDVNILKKIYCGTSGGSGSSGGTGGRGSGGSGSGSASGVACKDRFDSCLYWNSRGYCNPSSVFSTFTFELCPATCKRC
jgi:uncharacterized membrane protein YgcG